MSGRKTALEALRMTAEVETRLLAMGVPPSRLPDRAMIFGQCWPHARQVVKRRKQAALAAGYAGWCDQRAREAEQANGEHVARVAEFWRDAAGPELRRLVDFRPDEWHLALTPCPAPQDAQRREAA